jgi:hypothetical protein
MALIQDCISSVIDEMEDEEKGMLKCVLLFGDKLQEEAGDVVNSVDELEMYGKDVTAEWIASELNDIFSEGLGIMDAIKGIDREYANQLDIVINKVLVKSLHVAKPIFSKSTNSIAGAIQREGWIVEKLMDSVIVSMDEDARQELAKQAGKMLKERGIDAGKAAQATAALLTGGLTAARAVMGLGFQRMIPVVANRIIKMMFGRGLSLAAKAAMRRSVGILFGPIGWVITAITALPLITSLLNPRGYAKYISAVFIIGATRMSQNNIGVKVSEANLIEQKRTAGLITFQD